MIKSALGDELFMSKYYITFTEKSLAIITLFCINFIVMFNIGSQLFEPFANIYKITI